MMNQDEAADFKIGEFLNVSGKSANGIDAAGNGGDSGIRIPTLSSVGGEGVGAVGAFTEAGNIAHRFNAVSTADSIESVKSLVGFRRIVSIEDGEISASEAASFA